jgi:hypothetical protein
MKISFHKQLTKIINSEETLSDSNNDDEQNDDLIGNVNSINHIIEHNETNFKKTNINHHNKQNQLINSRNTNDLIHQTDVRKNMNEVNNNQIEEARQLITSFIQQVTVNDLSELTTVTTAAVHHIKVKQVTEPIRQKQCITFKKISTKF